MKIVVLYIFFFLFPIIANAQSAHALVWYIGNYCFDFRENPVKVTELTMSFKDVNAYFDSNSSLRLYSNFFRVRDSNGNMIPIGRNKSVVWCADYFIPKPFNENVVYTFNGESCRVVDLSSNEVVSEMIIENHKLERECVVQVHHSNWRDIWIVYYTFDGVRTFLLTPDGIVERAFKKYDLEEYPFDLSLDGKWDVNLSLDCNYYASFVKCKTPWLYYGKFNRSKGTFTQLCKHNFSDEYQYLEDVHISRDGTSLIVVSLSYDSRIDMLEFPIIDDTPVYENPRLLYSLDVNDNLCEHNVYALYGPDGKDYFVFGLVGNVGTLSSNTQGDNVFDGNVVKVKSHFQPHIQYVSSWFMMDYNKCLDLPAPSAQFDNASLCFGEPLNVLFRGTAPFSLDYTLDGEAFSVPKISTDVYKMPDAPGKYSITKVSDKNCSSVPEKNNKAVISREMEKLVIKIGE